jgi:HPt (histidine-containing phosphotransfer) domain-containing protein
MAEQDAADRTFRNSGLPSLGGCRPFLRQGQEQFRQIVLEEDSKASDRLSRAGAGAPIEPRPSSSLGQTVLPPEQTIDLAHLARMTCGEKSLEAEVLSLFDRQAGMLLARMQQSSPTVAGTFAHTIAGSARGIGAWKVAAAAEGLELAARNYDPARFDRAHRRLASTIAEAQAAIRALLAV